MEGRLATVDAKRQNPRFSKLRNNSTGYCGQNDTTYSLDLRGGEWGGWNPNSHSTTTSLHTLDRSLEAWEMVALEDLRMCRAVGAKQPVWWDWCPPERHTGSLVSQGGSEPLKRKP